MREHRRALDIPGSKEHGDPQHRALLKVYVSSFRQHLQYRRDAYHNHIPSRPTPKRNEYHQRPLVQHGSNECQLTEVREGQIF